MQTNKTNQTQKNKLQPKSSYLNEYTYLAIFNEIIVFGDNKILNG